MRRQADRVVQLLDHLPRARPARHRHGRSARRPARAHNELCELRQGPAVACELLRSPRQRHLQRRRRFVAQAAQDSFARVLEPLGPRVRRGSLPAPRRQTRRGDPEDVEEEEPRRGARRRATAFRRVHVRLDRRNRFRRRLRPISGERGRGAGVRRGDATLGRKVRRPSVAPQAARRYWIGGRAAARRAPRAELRRRRRAKTNCDNIRSLFQRPARRVVVVLFARRHGPD
mmetsp:Transcript_3818/g.15125  ORF Transcript_3818/g.15125 Transcript_3818/m.15125 type:complete len:230 (-) Transcript_3818:1537-2226(-)